MSRIRGIFVDDSGRPRKLSPSNLYLNKDGSRRRLIRRRRGPRKPLVPKPIRSLISPADVLTLMNFLCGMGAILYSIEGGDAFKTALVLILLGIVFDGLDGPVARRFGTPHRFGKWLDSIADATTFCIAPAFMLYNLFKGAGNGGLESTLQYVLTLVASLSISILGILRLGRFSMRGYRFPDFIGLPTPAIAFLAVSFCGLYHWSADAGILTGGWEVMASYAVPGVLTFGALAMVADVRYKRLRGSSMMVLGTITLVLISALIVGHFSAHIGLVGCLLGAFGSAAYLLSPLTAGGDGVWGAAKRMEEELEEMELAGELSLDEEENGELST